MRGASITHARDVTVISFVHIRGFDPMTQRRGRSATRRNHRRCRLRLAPISAQIATSSRVELPSRAFLLRHFGIRFSGVNRRQFRQLSRPFTTHPRCARRPNVRLLTTAANGTSFRSAMRAVSFASVKYDTRACEFAFNDPTSNSLIKKLIKKSFISIIGN